MSNPKSYWNTKDDLLISFSGGKTSGMMCSLAKKELSDQYNLKFVFANTSEELEETLIFVDKCDKYLGLNLVWVEALVNPEEGKGVRHQVVDFQTAKRKGEVFESVIKKYGIPNMARPFCTDRLKIAPINSYMRAIGWNKYNTAIGIRADEQNRLHDTEGYIYPLAERGIDKQDVNNFWEDMPFTLNLQDHEGNCKTCYKKSYNKLFKIIEEHPNRFRFFRRMEKKYSHLKTYDKNKPYYFFRGRLSTEKLFEMHKNAPKSNAPLPDPDESGGCSESCEAF